MLAEANLFAGLKTRRSMRDESEENSEELEAKDSSLSEVSDVESEPADGGGAESQWRDPQADLRALIMVLRRTGRALRRPVLIEGALWYGATLLAVILSGLLLAALFADVGYTLGRWVMFVGMSSATLGGAAALGLYLWRKAGPEQIAARIQRHSPEFRSDLVAALEFGHGLTEDGGESLRKRGFSEAMARAHLSKTTRRVLEACEENSLAHLIPSRDLTSPALAVSGGVALLLLPLLLYPGWTLGVLSGERIGDPVVGERVAEDTVVGYLDGVFVYPSYTGMDRQMMRLGSGYIESLEGTAVHLRATLMPGEWEDLELVLEVGDEEPRILEMARDGGNQASVTFELSESGFYWFRAKTAAGRPVEDRAQRRIRVVKDDAPRVRVSSHQGRIEVQPEDILEFDFDIEDDFGIDRVSLVHHFDGAQDDPQRERLNLPELSNNPRNVSGMATLDLQPLNLQPKDAIVVYFEARDNNTATGPGIGQSEPIVLYVESPEDKHIRNIARQQEVMEALVMHLADFLEAPVGARQLQDNGTYRQRVEGELAGTERVHLFGQIRRLHSQRVPIIEAMDELVAILAEDPLMVVRNVTLFAGLADRLQTLQESGDEVFSSLASRADRNDLTIAHVQEVADYAAEAEEVLERGILSLEELLISQKMDLVRTTAEDIEALRDRLRELLEQYRDTQDPELRAAIQREIQRLRQRMAELMQRMQMQLQDMPREHVNMEALEQMEMQSQSQELNDQLRAIEDMLDNDDIDGALEALEQMQFGLDALTQDMNDSFSSMEPQGLSELDRVVAEMMDEVNQLEDIERNIEERTRELQESLREERRDQLEEMIEPAIEEILELIRAQQETLGELDGRELPSRDHAALERAQQQMDALEEMAEQRDLEQALQRSRQAQNSLRGLRATLNLSERYAQQDTAEGRAVRQSRQDTDRMVPRADEITRRIEELMDQAQQDLQPGEEEQFDELADAQQQARERAQRLQETLDEQGQRYPALEQQLRPSMDASEEAMGRAEENLRQRQIQQALDEERSALEQLGQLRESMSQALEQQRQQERQQAGRERQQDRVEIPGEDSAEGRERLRREMMEGMREGRLQEYESQIERYFRSLVE